MSTLFTTDRLLTLPEAAALLRLHESSVRRRVSAGELPARKLAGTGRLLFRPEDIEAALSLVSAASDSAVTPEGGDR